MKIPGLNAPPPPGGAWGFHPGGWGKPPVDEFNRPLYGGDVFGLTTTQAPAQAALTAVEPVERTMWGELQPPDEESEEEEEEDESEEEEDEDDVPGGLQTPGGTETPGGFVSSVPTDYPGHGVETSVAGEMDLRKSRRGFDTEESSHPRSAYTVLPEKQARNNDGFFASERTYDLGAARNLPVLGQDDDTRKRKKPGDVDVALDPDAVQAGAGLSKDELRRKFEEGKKEEGVGAKWGYQDDLTEMIQQESRKRQKVEEKRDGGKKRGDKYRF
jgi:splicing factor 3B subunit 2